MEVRPYSIGRSAWPAVAGLVGLAAVSCGHVATTADHVVSLRLANAGSQPLHCRLLFGHWVEQDLGEVGQGAAVEIAMMQSARDGSLYIERTDGQRLMMIENIVCGLNGDWMGSFEQIDLAPVRAGRPGGVTASCAAPAKSGRVVCTAPAFEE